MTHKRLTNALKKAEAKIANDQGYWSATRLGRVITWTVTSSGKAQTVHCDKVRCQQEHTRNLYQDYFPGFFAYTIKEAIDYIKE